jgi:hypothetical protein
METTVNGQLMISMLVESLMISLDNPIVLQTNTDGVTFKIKRTDIDKYYEICREWEKKTKLILEFANYEKMIISDVNSYIAIYEGGKTKCKGRFEWEDLQNHKASHLHKNKSGLIIAKAVFNYFVNGINPKDYLQSNRNIFDYCNGAKIKGKWFFLEKGVEESSYYEKKLQKIVRYYVSNKGCKLIKCNPDGRQIQLEAGKHLQTVFNKYESKSWEEYGVNDDYYLDKIYSEIKNIESGSPVIPQHRVSNQLSLF